MRKPRSVSEPQTNGREAIDRRDSIMSSPRCAPLHLRRPSTDSGASGARSSDSENKRAAKKLPTDETCAPFFIVLLVHLCAGELTGDDDASAAAGEPLRARGSILPGQPSRPLISPVLIGSAQFSASSFRTFPSDRRSRALFILNSAIIRLKRVRQAYLTGPLFRLNLADGTRSHRKL